MTRVVPNLRHVGNEALQRLLVVDQPADPIYEFRFDPRRRWAFDVAYPDQKIYIEFEGGVWTGGRHTRGTGFIEDAWKSNQAAVYGWRGLRFTYSMLRENLAQCRDMLFAILSQETLPGREEEVGK